MTWIKIAIAAGGALAVAGLIALVVHTITLADEAKAYQACTKAAATPADPLDRCDPTVKARVTAARQADACEAAIGTLSSAKPDTYGVEMSCGANVKHLQAELVAAQGNLADVQAQLAHSATDTAAAVARAEARAVTTAAQEATDDQTIAAAPRLPDGRLTCDAQCLRDLAHD